LKNILSKNIIIYHSTGVQKLSETQKSKLRNGHPVRIKKGSGNHFHLTDDQIKKLEVVSRKDTVHTLKMHPPQETRHKSGEDLFGDIATKAKSFARKHKDLINPIIGRVRDEKVDEYIKLIEDEGIIEDSLRGFHIDDRAWSKKDTRQTKKDNCN
jgi:hypothetical protein